ncbi:MAG: indole-3-glycerol phosphate synthase TrpC [Hyphomicrobiaceae bacterium]|nr:indole-3-glycerol phosphate synthase TrpC [Hyphomicrobiaceae bacterium]
MLDILDKIVAYKKEEVALAKANSPLNELEQQIGAAPTLRPFRSAILDKISKGRFALIAEIKKASPSKGLIRETFAPAALARAYEQGGATCLSVLTDTPSFQGHPDFLREARAACALPVLRKDFMIDPYQVYEARVWGADAILLIMACTDDGLANELIDTAYKLNMDVLIEIHNKPELERALALTKNDMIGINNRNLKTFETSLETTKQLAPLIPEGSIIVAESGIFTSEDVQELAHIDMGKTPAIGVKTFLVGESLMRQQDVETATQTLLGGAFSS